MTLDSIVIQILEDFFSQFGIKYNKHDRTSLLLTRYFNFRLKYIVLGPRQIRVSKELSKRIAAHSNHDAIFDIFNSTISGGDLNQYQSKESFNADFHDLLYNDWGLHHLHLSSAKKSHLDYFNSRTGPLLFVRFTNDIAYFLDIKSHKDKNIWSDTDLIRIIQNNWPDIIAGREVPNVTWTPALNDEDIGILRKKGYLFGINVDDKAYLVLGHGQAASGDNLMASRMAGEVWRWVGQNEHLIKSDIKAFKTGLLSQLHI